MLYDQTEQQLQQNSIQSNFLEKSMIKLSYPAQTYNVAA